MGLAFFASLGLPGLCGFISEFTVFMGALPVYQGLTIVSATILESVSFQRPLRSVTSPSSTRVTFVPLEQPPSITSAHPTSNTVRTTLFPRPPRVCITVPPR